MRKMYFLLLTFLAFQLNAQYLVESISFESINFNDADVISLGFDDRFSEAIQFPFEFEFFGEDYNEITIGSNGIVSFNTDNANEYCPWQIDNPLPDATETTRFNTIMLLNDMNPAADNALETTGIYYKTTGSEPNRMFSVIFYDIPQYGNGCNTNYTSFEIKLFEGTNAIEVHVLNKPECPSWNDGNSAIAIQNADGTIAFTPPNRNVSLWYTEGEAWRFNLNEDYTFVNLSACSDNGVYPTVNLYDYVVNIPDYENLTFHLTPQLGEFGEFIENPNQYTLINLPTTVYFSEPIPTGYTTVGQINFEDDGECEEEFGEIRYELCHEGEELPVIDLTYIWSQVADVVDFIEDTFYLTPQDALNNVNQITNLTNFQMTDDSQSIYVRRYSIDNGWISYIVLEISLEDCDADNDNVLDEDEDLNNDGNLDNDDTDGDGTPNYLDNDDDGDSVPTEIEAGENESDERYVYRDTDGDGIEDYLDMDDDGDGTPTIEEDWNGNGTPLDDDLDEDGIPDYLDNTVNSMSVTDVSLNHAVKFYPNPVNEILNIRGNLDVLSDLQIYNQQGKLLMSFHPATSISLKQLSTGIYYISGKYKGERFTQKIIKN